MPRYKLGHAPADASIRNGKYRKTVDIPVEYLDALNALAKADNRDLKNYFETEIIKLAVGYNMALGAGRMVLPKNGTKAGGNHMEKNIEDAGNDKEKSTPPDGGSAATSNFLNKRRQGKGMK